MADKKTREDKRARNYTCIVYPESAPDKWQKTLADILVPALISPLHDMDADEETGEIKKPHYHVVIMHDNKKSVEQVKEEFDIIGGVGIEKIINMPSYARYLCHLDQKDKHQYSVEDVIELSGADYQALIAYPKDRRTAIREMMAHCRENGIISFAELAYYAEENREDWFIALTEHSTFYMKELLKSAHWTNNQK